MCVLPAVAHETRKASSIAHEVSTSGAERVGSREGGRVRDSRGVQALGNARAHRQRPAPRAHAERSGACPRELVQGPLQARANSSRARQARASSTRRGRRARARPGPRQTRASSSRAAAGRARARADERRRDHRAAGRACAGARPEPHSTRAIATAATLRGGPVTRVRAVVHDGENHHRRRFFLKNVRGGENPLAVELGCTSRKGGTVGRALIERIVSERMASMRPDRLMSPTAIRSAGWPLQTEAGHG